MEKYNSLGVVIGRFQVHELHEGHLALLDTVNNRHERMLILIGYNLIRSNPEENPFTYEIRQQVLASMYPNAIIKPLLDSTIGSEDWSKTVDEKIFSVSEGEPALLYGGRNSFIPEYSGVFDTVEIPELPNCSGTQLRTAVSAEAMNDPNWRLGWLAALKSQYAITDPTVDMAIHTSDWKHLLLGSRGKGGLLRFPGGFVESDDDSYEDVVVRERGEEVVGARVGTPRYIGSKRIKDPRYGRSRYGVMTTFFAMEYQGGEDVRAGDDIGDVEWCKCVPELIERIVPEHRDLFRMLLKYRAAQLELETQ